MFDQVSLKGVGDVRVLGFGWAIDGSRIVKVGWRDLDLEYHIKFARLEDCIVSKRYQMDWV